jgi:DNA-binding NarL/FixJ family response regulator
MSPQPSRGPSGPPGKHPHKATSKPTALPLGKIGVAIVDDDENFQVFLRDIVDHTRQFRCVGSYTSGEAALIGIPHSGAQVVLMDIKMPGMSGIECARRLKALLPHLIIVMITGLDDPRTIDLARESGAGRFLPKPFTASHLLATLSFCIPPPKSQIAHQLPRGGGGGHRGLSAPSLTARETRVMEYMDAGLLYKEIVDRTGVSVSAVHHMQSRIFKKLRVTNKVEALRKWKEEQHRSS